MLTSLNNNITFLTGDAQIVENMSAIPARAPFESAIVDFLNNVSKLLLANRAARVYSDVITFGFWIRRASILKLQERFKMDGQHMGKGLVFHIAPSNVPVNFAYSLCAGLLSGNANIVRVPSREFPQVGLIVDAFNQTLESHSDIKPYVVLVRYERSREVNDLFSSMADMRIVWGGDNTIAELRKSPLPPRSGEVTFADRYSLAIIDSESYLETEDKGRVAEEFYNDTFFSDQNACTSPRVIIWTGKRIEEAKKLFWDEEHKLAEKKYTFQPIQAVNKLTSSCLVAVSEAGCKIEPHEDNIIIRVKVPKVSEKLMDLKDNSGYFYEYSCKDILELKDICNDKRCQTIAYIGDGKAIVPLITEGVKGIDRIVPMGKTMDFDLIWDGYNLPVLLTRTIMMV